MVDDKRNLSVYLDAILFWGIVCTANAYGVIEHQSIFSALCLPFFLWMLAKRCSQWFYILTLKEATVSLPDEVNP